MNRPLHDALDRLKREFPDARLHEVRLEFSLGERSPDQSPADLSWLRVYWRVQIDNNHTCAETIDEAIAALRRSFGVGTKVQAWAQRIAAVKFEVLAEVRAAGGDGMDVHAVEMAVHEILERR